MYWYDVLIIRISIQERDCISDDSRFQSNIYSASNMTLCYDPMLLWQDISESFLWSSHYHEANIKENLLNMVWICADVLWISQTQSNWGGIKVYIYFDDDATMLESMLE